MRRWREYQSPMPGLSGSRSSWWTRSSRSIARSSARASARLRTPRCWRSIERLRHSAIDPHRNHALPPQATADRRPQGENLKMFIDQWRALSGRLPRGLVQAAQRPVYSGGVECRPLSQPRHPMHRSRGHVSSMSSIMYLCDLLLPLSSYVLLGLGLIPPWPCSSTLRQ